MKLITCFLIGILTFCISTGQSTAKWFDNESISTTVLLEKEQSGQFVPHGTGFLILPYKSKDAIVVTCAHVLLNNTIYITLEVNEKFRKKFRSVSASQQQQLLDILNTDRLIKWNTQEDFLRIKVNLIKDSTYFTSPNGFDVAALKINIPGTLTFDDSTYNVTNAKMIGKSRIKNRKQISLGDDTYFIGFPFGIGSPLSVPSQNSYTSSTSNPLLRKGTIAWISNDYDEFLLDAMSFGGNSGSPLFQVSYEPGKPPYYLIGIIIGHLEDSVSNANFGLARCLSVNIINKVIELADK